MGRIQKRCRIFGIFSKTKIINFKTMNIKDLNTKKKPVILIDKSLDFFNDKVLFPEKLAKANEMLRKVGLPRIKNAL